MQLYMEMYRHGSLAASPAGATTEEAMDEDTFSIPAPDDSVRMSGCSDTTISEGGDKEQHAAAVMMQTDSCTEGYVTAPDTPVRGGSGGGGRRSGSSTPCRRNTVGKDVLLKQMAQGLSRWWRTGYAASAGSSGSGGGDSFSETAAAARAAPAAAAVDHSAR